MSEMKSKQQRPCNNYMHWPVMSRGDNMVVVCTYSMHCIVKRVSWFRSSLLLRINNKHTYKY